MDSIILDSSFLIALEVGTDQNHEKAEKALEKILEGALGETIISDYIFDEIVTVTFLKTKDLEKAIFLGEKIKQSAKMIKIDAALFDSAWNIFKEQTNTKMSFTDCTNIAIMQSSKIKNIATFDKDFEKIKEINVISN
ncbi:type II toxin-antitoxin system VapC family toxin [Candidatus Pacearchaeota archaeon]|nr:type II toxin-antitoxin system VapC family toxin [Candidatus Pacearchaeota archaeon]